MSQISIRRSISRINYQGPQDEDILRQYNIPLTLYDITQSTTEEYNRHLSHLNHLNPEQIHIIKDIYVVVEKIKYLNYLFKNLI